MRRRDVARSFWGAVGASSPPLVVRAGADLHEGALLVVDPERRRRCRSASSWPLSCQVASKFTATAARATIRTLKPDYVGWGDESVDRLVDDRDREHEQAAAVDLRVEDLGAPQAERHRACGVPGGEAEREERKADRPSRDAGRMRDVVAC